MFRFFDPGVGVLYQKTVPGAGILTEKISGPGVSPGGMVTGQIDTCIIGDYVDGGYKDVNIETKLSSLRTVWIRRFLDNSFHAWKAILYSLLSDTGVTSIFHFNFKPSVFWCTENVSPFSALSADDCTVGKISDKEPDQVFEILNQ